MQHTSVEQAGLREVEEQWGWVLYVEEADVQVPVCVYDPVPFALLAEPDLSHRVKRAMGRLLVERSRRGHAGAWFRGPSCAEYASSTRMSETAWRRCRTELRERGLIEIRESRPHRAPDDIRIDEAHPLLTGPVLPIPRALAAVADAGTAHVIALIAYINGDRGPRPVSIENLAGRLGLGRSQAAEVLRDAIAMGYLHRLPQRGHATSFAVLRAGWWDTPGALIRGKSPQPVWEVAQTRPDSGGHVSDARLHPVRSAAVPTTPGSLPAGLPSSPSHIAPPPATRPLHQGEESYTGRGPAGRSEDEPTSSSRCNPDEGGPPPGARMPPNSARPPTVAELERAWGELCAGRYPSGSRAWSQSERRTVAALVKKHGAEEVMARLERHILTWSERRKSGWVSRRDPHVEPRPGLLVPLWACLGPDAPREGEDDAGRVEAAWQDAAAALSGIRWSCDAKDRNLAGLLARELGTDMALQLVTYAVRDWGPRSSYFASLPLIWSARGTIQAQMVGRLRLAETRFDRIKAMEYKPDEAKKHPKLGW